MVIKLVNNCSKSIKIGLNQLDATQNNLNLIKNRKI